MFIAAQLVGIVVIILNMLIYQQKSRTRLLVCKLLSDIASLLNFLLLGGFSGAAIALIGCFRELAFLEFSKDSVKGKVLMGVFMAVSLISAGLTWKGPTSILPAIAAVISVFGFSQGNPRLSRILSFPISACMGIYSASVASYTGVINEILTVISSAVGIIRHDLRRSGHQQT